MKYFVLIFIIAFGAGSFAAYGLGTADPVGLQDIDVQPTVFRPEDPHLPPEPADPVTADLRPFYDEFERDRKVSVYMGYGIGTYYPARGAQILEMLKRLAVHYKLPLADWALSPAGDLITFRNVARGVSYSITIGYERNEYIQAFSNYEIVMYHGHSRYGQGPAFQHYQNYFRMGRQIAAIEVDARNAYFRDEPILMTEKYPLRKARLGSEELFYQYRGQKSRIAKLPKSSYTKNIPGMDVDWRKTEFLKGRQLFYFYSCSNRQYWRDSIREMFPDIREKMVIGTYKIGRGRTEPDVLMLLSVLRRTTESAKILNLLNTTTDCEQCFTTF